MTVTRRLLLLMLPALAIVMFGGGVIDYLIAVDATRNSYDQALDNSALTLASLIRLEDGKLDVLTPEREGAQRSRFDRQSYAIVSPEGTLLAGNAALVSKARSTAADPLYYDASAAGRALRVVRTRSQTPAGPVTIYLGETVQRRERAERAMLVGKLSVDFVELDLALILVWISVYVGLRPLRRLHDVVEASAARELRAFSETEVVGEVRPLVRAFNQLLELLQDAAASQRRFVADAAHQLRTPIAGLSAQIELLLHNPGAAALAPELSTINQGIARVARSANQLLSLARTEQSSLQSEKFEPVALRPMLEELIGRNVDRAESLGLDLGAELQDATLQGDIWMLQDLAGNLLDNALKYTPRGGHVTVRCGLGPQRAPYVEVEDDGPGIPESERRRVRERFYRPSGSAAPGCGLGLAIVEEIARVHRATLSIEGGAGNTGARMRVRFTPQGGNVT
ncbi:MAG TPA: sensor histidine kinase N-terminal domain-containing protein [Steroidobacteraceae bacterium]|jgi:two-component system sensor histidine kinase TctE|nr:sensor histidine kinase N-terminal domain-containing protein [Steroidobacteraceae bacterium]